MFSGTEKCFSFSCVFAKTSSILENIYAINPAIKTSSVVTIYSATRITSPAIPFISWRAKCRERYIVRTMKKNRANFFSSVDSPTENVICCIIITQIPIPAEIMNVLMRSGTETLNIIVDFLLFGFTAI